VGGVFRDELGSIFFIFASHVRKNTNKAVKITSVVKGQLLPHQLSFNNLIVERDFSFIIQVLSEILCCANPDKVSHTWHLFGRFVHILEMTNSISTIIPSHVHRKDNNLADPLANEGVKLVDGEIQLPWNTVIPNQLQEYYCQLNASDNNYSDEVTCGISRTPPSCLEESDRTSHMRLGDERAW
jgi:hypothetical protein